ncbi:hypothetical protein ES703_106590 [subsurface metagenome]
MRLASTLSISQPMQVVMSLFYYLERETGLELAATCLEVSCRETEFVY